jgi:RNA polymerase sigma-70 factor (ECF subfamily)
LQIEEIILGCKKNEDKSQRELVFRFSGLLFTVSRRYAKDENDACDILQDGFIEIFNSINSFDVSKGGLENWMKQIVARTAIRRYRKMYMVKETYDKEITDQSVEGTEILDKLEIEEIMVYIASLPVKYREIFNLYVFDEFSHQEISEMLKIDESSSRSRLSRARKMLKEQLGTGFSSLKSINY